MAEDKVKVGGDELRVISSAIGFSIQRESRSNSDGRTRKISYKRQGKHAARFSREPYNLPRLVV